MITGKQLIGFSKIGDTGTAFSDFKKIDSTGIPVSFFEANYENVDEAVSKAASAFEIYRHTSSGEKISFLERIAEEIVSLGSMLIDVTKQETSLPQPRLEGELQRTLNQIKLFVSLLKEGSWVNATIDTALPDRVPLPKPDIRQIQVPLGIVAVFGASNFPYAFSVAGGDTISAFAAGCTVVCKAHPAHPATSELVGDCIVRAAKITGMPDGIFSLLQGAGYELSNNIVKHHGISAVAFTGSFQGGKALYDLAGKREIPIPVYAEMGSINPVFILPGMLQQKRDSIAAALAASNMLSAGQFCTNPGVFMSISSKEADEFTSYFSSAVAAANSDVMLTDKIYNSYCGGIETLKKINELSLVNQGVDSGKTNSAIPHVFETTGTFLNDHEELFEELFGPASIHVKADNKEQLFDLAKKLPGQLTATIWATDEDVKEFAELFKILENKVGRLIMNGAPTGVEVTHAMVHGGPFPATTDCRSTSVGTNAIYRFTRALCFQNYPQNLLPEELQDENKKNIWRRVNGSLTNESI
ncbi:MAG: aldehyde dehydrogenase (NADP(+)) [Ginsengibacter sp.]